MFKSLTLAAIASVGLAHDFSQCPGVTDQLGVTSLVLTPDPPLPGQNLNVMISGTTSVDVGAGDAAIDIKLFGVVVESLTFDVCSGLELKPACPVKAGSAWSAQVNEMIPALAPKGAGANVDIKISSSGKELSCINMYVQVGMSLNETAANETAALLRDFYQKLA